MPPGFQQGHRHTFITTVSFPRGEEQAPRYLLDLGFLNHLCLLSGRPVA